MPLDPVDPCAAVHDWVHCHRVDLVPQFDPILAGELPQPQRDGLMLLVAVGFHAGRDYQHAEEQKRVAPPAPPRLTEQQICKQALDCQDACNASGVLGSWKRCADALWELAREGTGRGTEWVNQHPAMQLFADKLSQLTGIQFDHDRLSAAYKQCYEIAGVP